MTFSAGSASYGNQTAAAAPEVVSWPVSSAKIVTSHLPSAKRMPQVSPETPAPMTAAQFRMRSGIHHQNGRPGEPAGAQSRQSLVCLCQRKCFCFSPYWDTRRNFQKLLEIAGAGEDENFTPFKNCDLRDDMGSGAEPVKAKPLGIATFAQSAKPNQAST